MVRPTCLYRFAIGLLWIAATVAAQEEPIKGTAVLTGAEEAAWWAGLSTKQQEKLANLFHPPWFDYLTESKKIAYCYVAQSLYDFVSSGVDSNPHDSYVGFAPLLLRTSFHSSGSYHSGFGTGGSNGGTIYNKAELEDDMNACVVNATDRLHGLLKGSAVVSLADAVIIAGVVALDSMKFPRMDLVRVQGGRMDQEKLAFRDSLTSPDHDPMKHFAAMYNLSVSELVAVIGGAHNFGAAHGFCSGYIGQWTSSPLSWSNPQTGVPEYFVDLLREDWRWYTVCTFKNGTASYKSLESPFANGLPAVELDIIPEYTCAVERSEDPIVCEEQAMRGCDFDDGLYSVSVSPCDINLLQMRLRADFFLKKNPLMLPYVLAFAADADLLAKEFGVAYRKLTHNGLDRCGLSGHGCGANAECIHETDAATGRLLSSSCVIRYFPQGESDYKNYAYGSWSLDHSTSIVVLVLLSVTTVLSIFLAFKPARKGTNLPQDVKDENAVELNTPPPEVS